MNPSTIRDYTDYFSCYKVLKRIHYLEGKSGYQTYLFNRKLEPIRYKFYPTRPELEEALANLRQQGFTISNGTKLAEFFNQTAPKATATSVLSNCFSG